MTRSHVADTGVDDGDQRPDTGTVVADIAFVLYTAPPVSGPSFDSADDAVGSSGADVVRLQTVLTSREQAEAIDNPQDREEQRQRDRAAAFGAQRAVLRREQ